MDKLADPDTCFLIPCAHCDALFQEGERFCPTCGKDQQFADSGGGHRANYGNGTDASFIRGSTIPDQGVGWLAPRDTVALQPDTDRIPLEPDDPPKARYPVAAIAGVLVALALGAGALLMGVDHFAGKPSDPERQTAPQNDPVATPANVIAPAPAPVAVPVAPPIPAPAPAPAPPSATSECNEALAALSLCQPK